MFLQIILCLINIILISIILKYRKKILFLEQKITQETHKRIFPILKMDIVINKSQLWLINDSLCYAKDIKIEDLKFDLGYDFKKYILLRFDPIDSLPPNEKVLLEYQVIDHDKRNPYSKPENLVAHLSGAAFEGIIHYSNIEDLHFTSIFAKKGDRLFIKETRYSPEDS